MVCHLWNSGSSDQEPWVTFKVIYLFIVFWNGSFCTVQLCSNWQNFYWHSASRGSWASCIMFIFAVLLPHLSTLSCYSSRKIRMEVEFWVIWQHQWFCSNVIKTVIARPKRTHQVTRPDETHHSFSFYASIRLAIMKLMCIKGQLADSKVNLPNWLNNIK